MNTGKRIGINTIATTVAEYFGLILSFIFVAIFARYLGVESYGTYAFAFSFVSMFRMLFDLGLNSLNVREIARNKDKTNFYFGNSLIIELISSTVLVVFVGTLVHFLGYDNQTVYIVLVAAICISFEVIGWVAFSIFSAYEFKYYEALIRIAGKFVYITLGFIGIFLQFTLLELVGLFAVASAIQMVIGYFVLIRKIIVPKIVVDFKAWPDLIKMALPFAIGGIFFDIYFNIDMTMVSLLKGEAAVGYYSIAYRFMVIFLIIPSALSGSLMPVFSRLYSSSSHDLIVKAFTRSVNYLLIISIPLAIGMSLISDIAILTIFGIDYENSIVALQILVWVLVFYYVNSISLSALYSLDRQRVVLFSLLGSVILNVALNFYLIPLYSYSGAAIATVITEVCLFIQYGYYLKKNGIVVHYSKYFFKPFFAGIVMGIILYFAKMLLVNLPMVLQLGILIVAGISTYFGVLYLVKGIQDEDIIIVKQVLGLHKDGSDIPQHEIQK